MSVSGLDGAGKGGAPTRVRVSGAGNVNRALDGDVVVIELCDPDGAESADEDRAAALEAGEAAGPESDARDGAEGEDIAAAPRTKLVEVRVSPPARTPGARRPRLSSRCCRRRRRRRSARPGCTSPPPPARTCTGA